MNEISLARITSIWLLTWFVLENDPSCLSKGVFNKPQSSFPSELLWKLFTISKGMVGEIRTVEIFFRDGDKESVTQWSLVMVPWYLNVLTLLVKLLAFSTESSTIKISVSFLRLSSTNGHWVVGHGPGHTPSTIGCMLNHITSTTM